MFGCVFYPQTSMSDTSSKSFQRTSSARIVSRTSLKNKLLVVYRIADQSSHRIPIVRKKNTKRNRVQSSSPKSILTDDSWLTIVLNSLRCIATGVYSAIFKLNGFFVRYSLLFSEYLHHPWCGFLLHHVVTHVFLQCQPDHSQYLSIKKIPVIVFNCFGLFIHRQVQCLDPPKHKIYTVEFVDSKHWSFFCQPSSLSKPKALIPIVKNWTL